MRAVWTERISAELSVADAIPPFEMWLASQTLLESRSETFSKGLTVDFAKSGLAELESNNSR